MASKAPWTRRRSSPGFTSHGSTPSGSRGSGRSRLATSTSGARGPPRGGEGKGGPDRAGFPHEGTVPVLVRGNHDNYLMQILAKKGLDLLRKFECGGFTFVHGHDDPGG